MINFLPQVSSLIEPLGTSRSRVGLHGVVVLLAASALCVVAASFAMPDSYAWRSNAISESAAQGVQSAWIARLGFLLFGCAVLWLAALLRPVWARGTYWMHLAFGLCMVGTAAFSHKPWLANDPFDPFEDLLHSFTATGMGFAFSIGVVARILQRENGERLNKAFDFVALIAATTLPPLGELWPSNAGVLQRTLFGIAYLWFAHEALTASAPMTRPKAPASSELPSTEADAESAPNCSGRHAVVSDRQPRWE